jgi:uncharacterized protein YyaL (SSP411 family)
VNWQPWSDASLLNAREANKPILLSIGYSACHWCHVMAHESFENPDCADVMNQNFVNIKVDREERPDLDKVYQLAHQLMTQQSGGWPLTVFLDPHSLAPFFSGTYFPPAPRYQLPGFTDLLVRIASAFKADTETLGKQGKELTAVLQRINQLDQLEVKHPDGDIISLTSQALESQYDQKFGGFGGAPKFPMPSRIRYLMEQFRYTKLRGDRSSNILDKVMQTLTRIARGGIYDQLAGGFYRYTVDGEWTVPHFEKMLYDNGELLMLFSDALQFGPDALFSDVVSDTADWLIRDMQSPEGAYYSAIDADSEGQEGLYYIWLKHKVKALLNADEYALIETLYGLDKPANFERHWVLKRTDAWRSVIDRLGLESEQAIQVFRSAKNKMFVERSGRVPPATDIKVLASWNGLAIKGMLRAYQQLREENWLHSAFAALDFAQQELWDEGQQRLYATWARGEAKHLGYLDDYANLMDACLTAMATRWRDKDVKFVHKLAETVINLFFDEENGGFFFTAHDHESLIYRPKPTSDEAVSPGNATMVQVLITLGHLFVNPRFLEIAEQTLNWAKPAIEQSPAGHVSFASALQNWVSPPELILIRGPSTDRELWLNECRAVYAPDRKAFFITYEDSRHIPDQLPKLASLEQQSRSTAYICQGLSCSLPITSIDELITALAR